MDGDEIVTAPTETFWPRTHTAGELRESDGGASVVLNGWVNTRRDLGGLIFIDIRDRYGVTQVLFDPDLVDETTFETARSLRSEFVIAVRGTHRVRDERQRNDRLPTGAVELVADGLQHLTLPTNLYNSFVLEGLCHCICNIVLCYIV